MFLCSSRVLDLEACVLRISSIDMVSRLRVILRLPYIPRIGRGRSHVVTALLILWNPPHSDLVQVEVHLRSVGRSLLTDQGLAGARSKFLRDRPLISSIVLSLGILSILASYLGVSLDRLYEVSTHTFPWIRYPWNTLRWKLQRYRCACGFISCNTKIPNNGGGNLT
jgi:hypothetical protein